MSASTAIPLSPSDEPEAVVAGLVERARTAMEAFADADQARVDEAVTALAWSLYKPGHAKSLAERAVEATGLGNVESKITKNTRKTFGTLRDLMRVKTVGIIEEDKAKGLVKWAKPVGVVAAISPSTNPSATPVNKAMMAVKGRNAVIIAPSPAASGITGETVDLSTRVTLFRVTWEAPERILVELTLTGDDGESVAFSEYVHPRNTLQKVGKRVR